MRCTMQPATAPDVLALLAERGDWLRQIGSRQWSGDLLAPARIAAIVAEGGTWLAVLEDGTPGGTITISPEGDPDFWTAAELAEPSWYISKMATSLEHGRGLGSWMLRWAVDQASQAGVTWCRLDVYRDAARLRDWYAAQGWEPVRTAVVPGKNSGALFRHPAVADPAARMFFGRREVLERLTRPPVQPGTTVEVLPAHQPGEVVAVHLADAGMPEAGPAPEYAQRRYTVRMPDGRLRTCGDADIDVAS